jgi:hypothetical protein
LRSLLYDSGFESLTRIHELAMRHGTEEQRERLNRLTAGEAPSPHYKPLENALFLSQASADLFEQLFAEVAELHTENRQLREMVSAVLEPPKKGGKQT